MTASPRAATPSTAPSLGGASPSRLRAAAEPDRMRQEHLARAVAEAPELENLIRLYYRHTPSEDLLADDPVDIAGAARSHDRLAQHRVAGRPTIRVLNPTRAADGWASPATVVQVVTDDMPYLVDSVSAELVRMNIDVHRVVHPIVSVRREVTGELQEVVVDAPPGGPADGLTESWMSVTVDRVTDADQAREIEQRLLAVINDVREVVEDSGRMAETALALADQLEASPPPLPATEVSDGAGLLRWLAAGHVTFLGYRQYELVHETAEPPPDGSPTADESGRVPTLRAVLASGLGVLRRDSLAARSFTAGPDAAAVLSRDLLVLTEASAPSTVHRAVHPYYIGVKTFDAEGNVTGEHRFLAVLTTTGLHEDVLDIPVIARRVHTVIHRAGFPIDSYSGQRMLEVIQTYPRTELFSTDVDTLYDTVIGVLGLAERRRLRLFLRRDPYGRFYSALVYLPRERYTTDSRLRMQKLLRAALHGTELEYNALVGASTLARVLFTVRTDPADRVEPDVAAIQDELADSIRTWEDRLHDELSSRADELPGGQAAATDLVQRYADGLPDAYKEDFPASVALDDLRRTEGLDERDGLDLNYYLPPGAEPGERRLKLYLTGAGVTLSTVLPVLQTMGVEVVDERPYEIDRGDGRRCWIYDFGLRLDSVLLDRLSTQDDGSVSARFQEAFVVAWRGAAEVDRFNALVLNAGLTWRQAAALRTYAKYLRQIGSPYSQEYMENVLLENTAVTAALATAFEQRFDPAGTDGLAEGALDEAARMIDEITGLDADRILRSFFTLIRATLRTNYFVRDADGEPRPYLAIKLDPAAVPDLPKPRPLFEIFVCSPRVEGVHLRFGRVARGGLRWSDRREDFRTEVLGLAKAQQVKNAVIVPVGAKGGFVVKRPPAPTGDPGKDREVNQAEAIACYRMFISGLLDLTDNLVDGATVPPQRVVRHDGDDTYLVVAADKGTATFSDVANEVAASYGFWLGDAFASGGSVGYDHKAMGITARGAWESVKRHFRELGVDTQRDDFTAVGIGDMSGDVFGNGMLRSEHIRLLAAFDHRHVFVDPTPDSASSYAERRRLFDKPRSNWDDYDRTLISPGGGVWSRTSKRIPVSEQMRDALGLDSGITELAPPELIRAILCAPADLLWNGGIGTYVKASTESHVDVGDKANDTVRSDANQLRVRVIGEGGNLGLTQRGRIEFATAGGKINTDAVDNAGGVDCSDHEVNIKIMLDRLVQDGQLDMAERSELLAGMTDEVADLVLADCASQNRVLGTSRAHSPAMLAVYGRLLNYLQKQRGLDRGLEGLPSKTEVGAREQAGTGLTSPELATLLGHVKLGLKHDLLDSDLPSEEVFAAGLPAYFPAPLRKRFGAVVPQHPLRRDITSTMLVNQVVDGGGLTYAFRLREELSTTTTDAVRAFAVATGVFELRQLWREIDEGDGAFPIDVADSMNLESRRLLDRASRWLLINRPQPLDIGAEIDRFAPMIQELAPQVQSWLLGDQAANAKTKAQRWIDRGAPRSLAGRVSVLLESYALLDIIEVTDKAQRAAPDVAALYFALAEHLDIDRMLTSVSDLERGDRWHALARLALRDDLYASLRALTFDVLSDSSPGEEPGLAIERWERDNASRLERARSTLEEIADSGRLDLPTLSVASRRIRSVVR